MTLVITHGAEVHRKLSYPPVFAQDLKLKIIDLAAGQHRRVRFSQAVAFRGRDQSFQRTSEHLLLLVAHNPPAAIGIADQACGVRDQNQALRVVQDFAGEIAFPLQLGLIGLQVGDVQHQAAVLADATVRVAHRESIDQHMDQSTVLAAQHFLTIPQCSLTPDFREHCVVLFGSWKHLLARITVQQAFSTRMSQHPD